MATANRDTLLRKPFNDFRNYPYGFARSGDFSIRESDALLHYGCLITAMLNGDFAPETKEDKSLLAVAKGEQAPETAVEKAWAKYQARINRPKVGSMYGRSKVVEDDSDFDSTTADDDLVVED
ncbi:DUF413 domain-containing protein [Aliidiomarina halalkaliphila]|uniref:Macrodomain Ori protein n=1 Tax=Aliidiomarina halalkaliphila TaxID=2593535 RepID=A0A552X0D3_9GAMM|nr:DUF413 domain-containing protein [Aliidiomarina halalkaliphila]TRW48512.1 DUF413 domain-containing protein [Aliidiomarina halalkaliphila]